MHVAEHVAELTVEKMPHTSICGDTITTPDDTLPGRRPSDETNAADVAGQGALDEGGGEPMQDPFRTPRKVSQW